jgi:hypothetical protein
LTVENSNHFRPLRIQKKLTVTNSKKLTVKNSNNILPLKIQQKLKISKFSSQNAAKFAFFADAR